MTEELKAMFQAMLLTTNLKHFKLEILEFTDPKGTGFRLDHEGRGYYSSTDFGESAESVFFDLLAYASEQESNQLIK